MRSIRQLILFCSLVVLPSFVFSASASAENWNLDSLKFLAIAQGDSINGSFKKIRSSVFINFDELTESSAEIIIPISSLSVPKTTQREMLLGKDFFEVDVHKVARFVSQTFIKIGDNRYAIQGILTIRGISRTVNLPFTLHVNNTIIGRFNIDRTWFGIGRGSWESESKISRSVQISYELSKK